MPSEEQVTGLLKNWADGDESALDQLTPLVYDELRRLARRLFAGEKAGHTWQPTALVHEAFAKLVEAEVSWESRAHFYALSARMMRRLLVNHAVARKAGKRGGDAVRVTFVESSLAPAEEGTDLLALNEALAQLAGLDARKAELVELQYFAGLTFEEMSAVTGLSSSTLDRELRFARAWLKDRLSRN
jgi:RNA polymerase sigma factor (TIGR02999 family)